VVATGFGSVKGQVIKAMMHTSESRAKFYGDAVKFVGVFGAICAVATLIALFSLQKTSASVRDILFRTLDLISIGIPPALPLTLSIGIALALRRLKEKGIICLSPMAVIAAGKTSVICFDKTGTLTEETMQFEGTVSPGSSLPIKTIGERLTMCLACCNSVTMLNDSPLGAAEDLCLRSILNYEIAESNSERVISLQGRELRIVRIFHFSSSVKRMAVLVAPSHSSEMFLYLKGAPEEIKPLFRSLPPDYSLLIEQFTQSGYRVLACGSKVLPTNTDAKSQLKDLEQGLHFLGFVLLKNSIKPEAIAMVGKLMDVGYRAMMSTGDNVLTGISVAIDLSLIPRDFDIYQGEIRKSETSVAWTKVRGVGSAYLSDTGRVEWLDRIRRGDTKFALAVSGKAFSWLVGTYKGSNPRLLRFVLAQIYVCGRMSPLHKIQLIEELKRLGLVVAMVGDSASDSGSLKAADVGLCVSHLSLSLASPLTAASVLALEDILKEGKATLAASFQCFKFMGLYSMVQLMSVLTLYLLKTNFSTLEFLYVDLFTVIPLTFVIGITKAYPVLTSDQPPGSIFSLAVGISIAGQCCIQMTFIALTYYALTIQSWYTPLGKGMQVPVPIIENTVFFLLSNFQYLIACLVYSAGPPFRMPLYTNPWFTCTVLLLFSFNWYLVLAPHPYVLTYLGVSITSDGRRAFALP
jgi:cation-transporting ATPase 13A3/4/5